MSLDFIKYRHLRCQNVVYIDGCFKDDVVVDVDVVKMSTISKDIL